MLRQRYGSCEGAVVAQCREILQRGIDGDPVGYLDVAQNARLVSRAMYQGVAASWNLRNRHMFETLEQILQARVGRMRGPSSGPATRRSAMRGRRHTTWAN